MNFVTFTHMKSKPILSSQTFWDINIDSILFDEHSEWIIERVFDKGSLEEVISIINYYGKDEIKNTLLNISSYLPNHSVLLAKAIFNINFTDFKCLEKRAFLHNY